MNFLHADAPLGLALAGWLIVVPAVALALREVRSGFLTDSADQHRWLAAIVAVALLWAVHVRSPSGLDFGLLGSALFALVFGRARAILGLVVAVLLYTALTGGSWLNVGLNGLVMAILPAALATFLQRQIERRLPRNLFVFIIGNGMFVTLAVTACANGLLLALPVLAGTAAPRMLGDHVAYALLLAWGEALLSGMLFSALVVFSPRAVLTYRQDLYLPPRRRML